MAAELEIILSSYTNESPEKYTSILFDCVESRQLLQDHVSIFNFYSMVFSGTKLVMIKGTKLVDWVGRDENTGEDYDAGFTLAFTDGSKLDVLINNQIFNCSVVEKPFFDPKKKITSKSLQFLTILDNC